MGGTQGFVDAKLQGLHLGFIKGDTHEGKGPVPSYRIVELIALQLSKASGCQLLHTKCCLSAMYSHLHTTNDWYVGGATHPG